MRIKLILNPTADRGRAWRLREQIAEAARPFGELSMAITDQPGHATTLARAAVDDGYDVVAAAGGDGTAHEVVNGLMEGDKGHAALGLVPIGTGNDLAWGLDLLGDIETSVGRLFNGRPQPVDLGRIEDDHGRRRFFANGLGIGFDAQVAIESLRIQRLQGFALYLTAALRTILFKYDAPGFHIRFDDTTVRQKVLLLAVGNGPRAGGGFLLTPHARHDDGLLDTCTVRPVSRAYMLMMMLRVMKGTHISAPPVTMRRNAVIDIESTMPLPIHSDGEIFAYPEDNVRRVTIAGLADALPIMFDA